METIRAESRDKDKDRKNISISVIFISTTKVMLGFLAAITIPSTNIVGIMSSNSASKWIFGWNISFGITRGYIFIVEMRPDLTMPINCII